MKNKTQVNIVGPFEAQALNVLRRIRGLNVVVDGEETKPGIGAMLHFAGRKAALGFQFRQRANAATAWELVHRVRTRPKTPLLLIAGETTAACRTILEDHGIAVVDGLGNAHIELPGLLFHLEGRADQRKPPTPPRRTRLRGKAGLVAQALLLDPTRSWQIKGLAEDAQVSGALAHRVLTRLESEGIIVTEGSGPKRVRQLRDPTALLDLWCEENVERPTRTLAHRLAQTPQQLIEELGHRLGDDDIDHAFTGAAAGSLIAPLLTALPVVELWVAATADPEELCATAEADMVTEGHNIVFLQAQDDAPLAFRQEFQSLWIVNRFRLYCDLLHNPQRGREQADHLRRELIGFEPGAPDRL